MKALNIPPWPSKTETPASGTMLELSTMDAKMAAQAAGICSEDRASGGMVGLRPVVAVSGFCREATCCGGITVMVSMTILGNMDVAVAPYVGSLSSALKICDVAGKWVLD